MNDKKRSIWSWLDLATAGIRFQPDREAVKEELAAHLEDKIADFQRIFSDMTRAEAQDRAVDQMGDPEEIGRELARIHKPWLGYLWRVSRILVQVMACVAIAAVLCRSNPVENLRSALWTPVQDAWESWENRAVSDVLYGAGQPDWDGQRIALYFFDEEARLGRCTISIDRGALWQEGDGTSLYVELRLDYDRPWEAGKGVLLYFWAEDDLGNRYDYDRPGVGYRGEILEGIGWLAVNYRVDDVSPEAEWLKFHYMPGTDLDLTLDLTEVRP